MTLNFKDFGYFDEKMPIKLVTRETQAKMLEAKKNSKKKNQ